jgi:poly-gamma-glutamate synthesis protein (capsule biosynthesis protein)
VGHFIDEYGGPSVLAKVKPFLESAHLAFINLECPISDKGTRTVGKEYTFRGRTALVEGLVSAGIDVVSLANNHVLDYGQTALRDTIRLLDEAGVAHAGAGTDSSQAAAPTLLITPAGTVALLAFTEIIPGGFEATSTRGGVNPAVPDYKKMLSAIKAAAAKTDFVVVSMHWGTEYTRRPSSGQQTLAHRAIDAGADLIIGHHPHVIQGIELYKDKLIAYSLGDFVFDHYSRQTGEAFVFRVSLPRQGPPALEIVPVYLDDKNGVPSPVSGAEADTILGRLTSLSADLGLKLVQEGDRAKLADDPLITP